MTVANNNLDGGTNGTTVTAANSGGTSGTAFDSVTAPPAGGTLAFDNSQSHTGALSLKVATTTTAGTPTVTWSTAIGAQATIYGRTYFRTTGSYPAAKSRIINFMSTATQCASITLGPTGLLSIRNNSSTDTLTSVAVPLDTWVRIEFRYQFSTTTGNADLYLFNTADSVTADDHITATAQNFGASSANTVGFGQIGSSTTRGPFWFDDLQVNNTGLPGPTAQNYTSQVDDNAGIVDTEGLTDGGLHYSFGASGGDNEFLTDSVTTALAHTFSAQVDDPAGNTDGTSVASVFARQQSDTAGNADTAATVSTFARQQDDPAGTVDTALPVSAFTRQVDDPAGTADTATGLLNGGGTSFTRTIDDPAGTADGASVASAFVRQQDDPAGNADTALPVSAFVRQVSDTTGLTDTGLAYAFGASGTDSAGLTDSASAVLNSGGTSFTRTIDDPEGLSDAGSPQSIAYGVTQDDAAGTADTVTVVSAFVRQISDIAGTADAASGVLNGGGTAFTRSIDDPAGTADTATAASAFTRQADDPAGTVDTATVVSAFARQADDPAGLTDATTVQKAGAGTAQIDDLVGLTDSAATASAFARQVDDPAGTTDAVTAGLGFARQADDVTGTVDTASVQSTFARQVDDPTGLTDTTSVQKAGAGTVQNDDNAGLTDTLVVTFASVPLTDLVSMADSLAFAYTATINDTTGLTDPIVPAGTYVRQISDGAGITESLTSGSIHNATSTATITARRTALDTVAARRVAVGVVAARRTSSATVSDG